MSLCGAVGGTSLLGGAARPQGAPPEELECAPKPPFRCSTKQPSPPETAFSPCRARRAVSASKALLIAGAGVGLRLDSFRRHQLFSPGFGGGMADRPWPSPDAMERPWWVGVNACCLNGRGHDAGRTKHRPFPARGGTEKYTNRIKMDPFVRNFGVCGR